MSNINLLQRLMKENRPPFLPFSQSCFNYFKVQSAEDVAAADNDADLYAHLVYFLNLCRIFGKAFLVDAVLLFTHQALAAEFQ